MTSKSVSESIASMAGGECLCPPECAPCKLNSSQSVWTCLAMKSMCVVCMRSSVH